MDTDTKRQGLTTTEAARIAGVSRQAIAQAVQRGSLRHPLTATAAAAWGERARERAVAIRASRKAKIRELRRKLGEG